MFKTMITATTLSVAAASAYAATPVEAYEEQTQVTSESTEIVDEQGTIGTDYYCEWINVDPFGGWLSVWQCY